ncbi:MAG TPA: hypothetical protein VJR89_15710 [Polyangiales bacterium]|nr:hypothetical protein [Polyangiales bacterium]
MRARTLGAACVLLLIALGCDATRDWTPPKFIGAAGSAAQGNTLSVPAASLTPATTAPPVGMAAPPAQPSAAAPPPGATQLPNPAIPETFMQDAGDGWKTLVTRRWELPPGEETYQCVRFTLPMDVAVGAFRALSPAGTHHTVLMVDDTPMGADGTSKCDGTTTGTRNIAGSGVGTADFTMPPGVGIELEKGQQLLLNLHLFNVTDKPIAGQSGTLIKVLVGEALRHRAEGILAGTVTLSIPSGMSTQTGTCTMDHDVTLFGIGPHMHQLGVHMKAVAHSSLMGDVVLSDKPYDFEMQTVYPLTSEVQMKAGDTITVECTYLNATGKTVMFGESTFDEMCFAGTYRYPAGTGPFVCVL